MYIVYEYCGTSFYIFGNYKNDLNSKQVRMADGSKFPVPRQFLIYYSMNYNYKY